MPTGVSASAACIELTRVAALCRTELFSYETCIFYTVITSLITLDRKDLKSKARPGWLYSTACCHAEAKLALAGCTLFMRAPVLLMQMPVSSHQRWCSS